jgi:hypothetical protein
MKKRVFPTFLGGILSLCLSSGLVAHSILPRPEETLSIKTGTSFGHCGGYCTQEFVITWDKIIYTQIANPIGGGQYPKGFQPLIKQEIPIKPEKWADLLKVNAYKEFQKLPNTIDCPDCADGGAEWIEVNKASSSDCETPKRFYSKKVTFEYGKPLPANNAFAEKLRQLRTDIIKQYGKK